jgi:uncharacterized protein (DUF952 family)
MKADRLFHITTVDEARQAGAVYVPRAFDVEGFIHCSYLRQICEVANRRFAGRADLVLLEIDRHRLTVPVVDENLEGGLELFPHVYGRLPMTAVARIHEFPCDAGGRFALPGTLAIPSTSC